MSFDITIDCSSFFAETKTGGFRVKLTAADPRDFDTDEVREAINVEDFVDLRKKEVFDAIDKDEFLKHHGLELKEE